MSYREFTFDDVIDRLGLALAQTTAHIDPRELALSELPRILGILCHILQQGKRELRARSGEGPRTIPA